MMKEKMIDSHKLELAKELQSAISLVFQEDIPLEEIYAGFSKTPKWENGHLAYACFPLAKSLKQAPPKIAGELSKAFEGSSLVSAVKAMGPYLNFFFDFSKLGGTFLKEVQAGGFFEKELFSDHPKTMVEYSQPNTHKELHVGHMRNLCLGNALVEAFRYAKIKTLATTYPGDVGTHVAKTLWYLEKINKEKIPLERKGAWLGQIYSKAHNYLEEERGTEREEENRKELAAILKEIKSKSGKFYELWKETRQWSLDLMKDVYNWAGVQFDHWFFESEVDESSLKLVDEYYKKGLFIKDQGAIGIDLSDDKLGFLLLKKSDGNGLYSTKDLELARKKFNEFKIDKNIYVVDKRQALHFQQVFKTLEKMGFEQAKDCYHLAYDFVELPDGAMSSRKGNIIPLQKLIDQMETHITENYLNKYEQEWGSEEISKTAGIIANGAIKYGMCRLDSQKKIVFDMEEWLKLDGNSGPYLQYTYARIRSIINKVGKEEDFKTLSTYRIEEPIEEEILFKLTQFNTVVQTSVQKMSPHFLCNYLYDLCQDFNRFYAAVSIAKSEDGLKKSRLLLIDSYAEILKKGLSLLGIDVPERM